MVESAPVISPSSEEHLWSKLRNRVEAILEDRRVNCRHELTASESGPESERGKSLREGSLLLIRGFDSVSSSLSQLADTLTAAQQGANALSKSYLTEQAEGDDEEPQAKRHRCSVDTINNINQVTSSKTAEEDSKAAAADECQDKNDKNTMRGITTSDKLKRACNLAVAMATRTASLAKEVKSIKSELRFLQESSSLLEEENRQLRRGYDKGVSAEEDDLMRLQLEALLAEKSRLAQQNANLTRENQSLLQLVEYHQLTSQDLRASCEEIMEGMLLDFSSPMGKIESDDADGEDELDEAPAAPTDKPTLSSSHRQCSSSCID